VLRAPTPGAAALAVAGCVAALRAANLRACPTEPTARFQRCATHLLTMVWARRPRPLAAAPDLTAAAGGAAQAAAHAAVHTTALSAAERADFEEVVAAAFAKGDDAP
jgi:hypothetical protein